MKKIVILVAMEKELTYFLNYLHSFESVSFDNDIFYKGYIGNNQIILGKSGIGKVAASSLATMLIVRFAPDLIINMGIAGGYDHTLKTLDTIIVTAAAYSDVDMTSDASTNLRFGQLEGQPLFFEINENLLNKVHTKLGNEVLYGKVLSGDQFVTDFEKCEKIVKTYFKDDHILAFDMETCAIMQVCKKFSISCIVIRTISDLIGSTNSLDYEVFSHLASEKSCKICLKLLHE